MASIEVSSQKLRSFTVHFLGNQAVSCLEVGDRGRLTGEALGEAPQRIFFVEVMVFYLTVP